MKSKLNLATLATLGVVVAAMTVQTDSAEAGMFDHLNLFRKKQQRSTRPVLRPYNHPTYGYYATRWRRFPGAYYPHEYGPMGSEMPFGVVPFQQGGPSLGSEYIEPPPIAPAPYGSNLTAPGTGGASGLLPPVAVESNTEALEAIREAVTPLDSRLPATPFRTPPVRTARPEVENLPAPPAEGPPARRTSYSIKVAPNYSERSDFGLPKVRPRLNPGK